MRILRSVPVLLFTCLFFNSCLNVKSSDGLENKPYFDLELLIKEQVEKLNVLNEDGKAPIVLREISFGEKKENIELNKTNDSDYPNWEKELLLFKEADINKPVLISAYEEIKTDRSVTYKALSAELKVQELAISFKDAEVETIKIILNKENYLYTSTKSMEMNFENNLIKSYKIIGFRKLVTTQSIDYLAITNLSYPKNL